MMIYAILISYDFQKFHTQILGLNVLDPKHHDEFKENM